MGSAITQLLREWSNGNDSAVEELMPLVYSELRRLADGYMRGERPDHTLQPTALIHEAYLRLVDQKQPGWQSRSHFFRFELVCPLDNGGYGQLGFFSRDNDTPGFPWRWPAMFPEPAEGLGSSRTPQSVTMIKSSFGNLEVIARSGGMLMHFRSSDPLNKDSWNRLSDVTASGASGNPVLIQSRFGSIGNFELVVPWSSGGLAFFWYDNDNPGSA